MSEFDELTTAKNNLMMALGDKWPLYLKCIKKWFKMECNKFDFDRDVRKFMNSEQRKYHNRLLLKLFNVCIGLADPPPRNTSFQSPSIHDYVTNVKQYDRNDPVYERLISIPQERWLLDPNLLFGRLTQAAWENNLDGAQVDGGWFLLCATETYLKSVLTTILSERCGFKVRERSFQYELGCTVPNPWLRSAAKWNEPELHTSRVSWKRHCYKSTRLDLAIDPEPEQSRREDLHLLARDHESDKPEREMIEHNIVLSSAKVNHKQSRNVVRSKITLQELYAALRINFNAIPSQSIYFTIMEKIISNMRHPTWDEYV